MGASLELVDVQRFSHIDWPAVYADEERSPLSDFHVQIAAAGAFQVLKLRLFVFQAHRDFLPAGRGCLLSAEWAFGYLALSVSLRKSHFPSFLSLFS